MREIEQLSEDAILVLPEYCWGEITHHDLNIALNNISERIVLKQQLVLGSAVIEKEGKKINAAIYLNGSGDRIFVPKTNVLREEQRRKNVEKGKHPGIISYNGINMLVVVCGDLWNGILLNNFFSKEKVDLLCVPAFTAVPPNFSNYAKTQWYSLTITRSREFIVPIVVADHHNSLFPEKYDVGQVSSVADPSLKFPGMSDYTDFLFIPTGITGATTIDIKKVQEYRKYRTEKGLYIY